jgi:hypothetical protein
MTVFARERRADGRTHRTVPIGPHTWKRAAVKALASRASASVAPVGVGYEAHPARLPGVQAAPRAAPSRRPGRRRARWGLFRGSHGRAHPGEVFA